MAGPCITAIKVIGVSSLGLLSSSLAYQSLHTIPTLIRNLNGKVAEELSVSDVLITNLEKVKRFITNSRIANVLLGVVSSGLLTSAFRHSVDWERHPYLVYTALAAPVALAGLYATSFPTENKLLRRTFTNVKKPAQTSDEQDGDDLLSKSYIHVSDEESSTNSTPASTGANSPQISATETQSIDDEVEVALAKKLIVNNLEKLKSSYTVGTGIATLGFLIGSIGLVGDYFFLA